MRLVKLSFFVLCTLSHFATFASSSPKQVVSSLGFSLVNSEPIDIPLVNLQGKESRLSAYKGKWIFLTFWATWCGPCQHELPTLESLYQELKSKDLEILGVSTDSGKTKVVKKFVKAKGLSFPVFVDNSGIAASKYKAFSVPSIYLISPDWRLVGVLRGGKSWSTPQMVEGVRKLLEIKQIPEEFSEAKIAENGAVELPNNLIPPVLNIELERSEYYLSDEVLLTVAVSWQGDLRSYLFKVPKLILPDGVTLGQISSSSSSLKGKSTLVYKYPLQFQGTGEFSLGPVELSYRPSAGGKELFSRAPEVKLVIKRSLWKQYWWIFLIVPVVIGLVVILRPKKEQKVDIQKNAPISLDEIEKMMALKVKGKQREFETYLLQLNKKIAKETDLEKINRLLEKISYAGGSLTPSELASYEKAITKYQDIDDMEE